MPIAVRFERDLLSLADWFVVAIVVALPWSTSVTQVFGVAWLFALIPTLSIAAIRRELTKAAGGVPVALWCLGLLGTLWAHVGWAERLAGLNSFHRLLVIPLLLAQFRRSRRGPWVLYGFLASSMAALVASYVLIAMHSDGWRGNGVGVAIHDDVFQSTLFLICAFGLLGVAWAKTRKQQWSAGLPLAVTAICFLLNFAYVQLFSRITLATAPVLTGLLAWRWSGWRGLFGACAVLIVLGTGLCFSSYSFRTRLQNSVEEVENYLATNRATSLGMHVAFLEESLSIIKSAPIIGHGTGSIPHEFRQIAAQGSGANGVSTDNPMNQTFTIAVQLGISGAVLLWWMWAAHLALFRGKDIIAWFGMVIVAENIISSTVHSHLFDFANGWLYIFGVGVLGGMSVGQQMDSKKMIDQSGELPVS